MKVRRGKSGGLCISHLPLWVVELLQNLPEDMRYEESESARKRLLQQPYDTEKLNREWRSLVGPDLRKHFKSAEAAVAEDLSEVEEERSRKLEIPEEHLNLWVHALAQARLVLAEKHGFSEAEMEAGFAGLDPEEESDLPLLRYHFYAILQEVLLEV